MPLGAARGVMTRQLVAGGGAPYSATPVNFDGTNDYIRVQAAMSGAVDSANYTFSLWVRRTTSSVSNVRVFIDAIPRVAITFLLNNLVSVVGRNSAGTNQLELQTLTAVSNTSWHHLMMSRNATTNHLYLDGASSKDVIIETGAAIDFDGPTDWGVGAKPNDATGKFSGDLADVWIAFGQYMDLSQSSERAKFISGGAPVDLGASGATPTGTSPTIFLSGSLGSWHTNKGTGGGFTVTGALSAGTSPVAL